MILESVWTKVAGTWQQMPVQPLDDDLTAIAGLTPADDDFVQRKAGAWINRNLDQVRSDLDNVSALSDAATIVVNAALASKFRVTLGGNRTLGNPSGAHNGQMLLFELIQDATGSRTITLDTKYVLGTDISAVTLSTGANKRDFLGVIYNSTADKFYVIAFVKGY